MFLHSYYGQNYAGIIGRDQPIMLLFLTIMLCCNALKIYLLCSLLCSRTRIVVRLLYFLCASLQKQLITCTRILLERLFYQSVFAIGNKYNHNPDHTMTVLLEYIDHLLKIFINALILLLMYFIYFLLCWHYALTISRIHILSFLIK